MSFLILQNHFIWLLSCTQSSINSKLYKFAASTIKQWHSLLLEALLNLQFWLPSIIFFFTSFGDCLYRYWKPHFISLPNIQFHRGMRKCCLSLLLTKIGQQYSMLALPPTWQHCCVSLFDKAHLLPVGFHLALLSVTSS